MEIWKIQENCSKKMFDKKKKILFYISPIVLFGRKKKKKKKDILLCMRLGKLKKRTQDFQGQPISRQKQPENGKKMLNLFLQNHGIEILKLGIIWLQILFESNFHMYLHLYIFTLLLQSRFSFSYWKIYTFYDQKCLDYALASLPYYLFFCCISNIYLVM